MRFSMLLLLVGAMVPAPSLASEDPEEMLPPRSAPRAIDPNGAPLSLLSRLPFVGRDGAARIGAARGARPLASREDLADLLAVPVDSLPDRLAFSPSRSIGLSFRQRAERTEAGLRLAECAEVRAGGVSALLFAERDPGERRLDDFVSWSIAGGSERRLAAVAGDLSVRLGSGLLVGTSAPFGVPSDFGPYESSRLSPYRSRMESAAHRGVGLRRTSLSRDFLFLLTSTKRDARVDTEGRVSSIDDSGLHRDEKEEARRDRLHERIAGLRWEERRGRVRFGWTAAGALFRPPLGGGSAARKPKAFRGDRLLASSVDLRLDGRRTLFIGEIAHSTPGGSAGRVFLRRSIGAAKGLVRFRNFSGRFHAPRSTAFHRLGSEPSGEIGVLLLLEAPAGKRSTIALRHHRYASFDRTYNSEGRVFGTEWAVDADRTFGRAVLSLGASGGTRSEVRKGRRVAGETLALSLGASLVRSPARFRIDAKGAASSLPGSDIVKTGLGVSFLASFERGPLGTVSVSFAHLFMDERSIAFPSPALPGSLPFAFFGGGREAAGIRVGWKGFRLGRWEGSLVLGPGRAGIEVAR
ncbi:MAG: hypothetical protein FJY73_09160 [Candidatus Eisenbacteria bacterium]|nr:hypothetical protein [Candidatus Eisenbacteria bacterium]